MSDPSSEPKGKQPASGGAQADAKAKEEICASSPPSRVPRSLPVCLNGVLPRFGGRAHQPAPATVARRRKIGIMANAPCSH